MDVNQWCYLISGGLSPEADLTILDPGRNVMQHPGEEKSLAKQVIGPIPS